MIHSKTLSLWEKLFRLFLYIIIISSSIAVIFAAEVSINNVIILQVFDYA
jgi:putative cell wall-binding protein